MEVIEAYKVVDRTENMSVVYSTQDFKLKPFPDRLVKMFKGQFLAHGDK